MFGKIKKVLISLALAASLALAPMNVCEAANTKSGSAADGDGDLCVSSDDTTKIETPIYVTIEEKCSWTVTVPDSFSLTSKGSYTDSGNIELGSNSSLGSKTLKVTPNLNRESAYSNIATYPIDMMVNTGMGDTPATVSGNTVSFTKDNTGAASLEVSIEGDTWETSCQAGLNNVKVAGITYAIALT